MITIHTLQDPVEIVESRPRSCKLYKYYNVSLGGKSLYYPNVLLHSQDQWVLPINERFMSFNRKTWYEEQGMLIHPSQLVQTKQNESNKYVLKDPVYFFVYNVENYYHFIYDTLPYLYWFFILKQRIPNLRLVTQYPTPKHLKMFRFVQETLELLGCHDFLILNPLIIYETIYISSSLTHEDASECKPNQEAWEVWNTLKEAALTASLEHSISIPCGPKMYISRRTHLTQDTSNIGTNYTQRRKMLNEDDLVGKLNACGYQEVFPEQWSMVQKILAFHHASHVVGAIGGGMCNLLFSSQSTQSVVIVSPEFMTINNRFKYSMDHTSIRYWYDTHVDSLYILIYN